jgi:hypothetical protein
LDAEKQKKERADYHETEFNPRKMSPEKKKHLNEKIKSRIEKQITRSMANQNKQQIEQAIAVINHFIIPNSEKLKLKTIAKKIYQFIQQTKEEASFWNSFPNTEKSYILTGDTAHTIDFTEYQDSNYCSEHQEIQNFEHEKQNWEEPNLCFEPSTSDSDSSEGPDYIPQNQLRSVISNTDDSWPDNSNSTLGNHPSTSGQLPKGQNNQDLDSNLSTETSEAETTPPKITANTQSTKHIVDSLKNTVQTLWKPASKVVINPDPEAISTRTRNRVYRDVPKHMASHPHDLNIYAMCCDKNQQKCAESPGSFQTNWKLCNKCALPSHQNTSQSVKNY